MHVYGILCILFLNEYWKANPLKAGLFGLSPLKIFVNTSYGLGN